MGMCDPQGYRNQQEQLGDAAQAALDAQYRAIGRTPTEKSEKPFIEGEFEVVNEPEKTYAGAFFGIGDPVMDDMLRRYISHRG